MYCVNCGKKIDNGNTYCICCGMKVNSNIKEQEKASGKKVVSIIFGSVSIVGALWFVFSPVTLIMSIIGLILAIVSTRSEKNIIGIILNSIGLVISLIMTVLLILLFRLIFSIPSSYKDEYNNDNYKYEYYDKFKEIIDIY